MDRFTSLFFLFFCSSPQGSSPCAFFIFFFFFFLSVWKFNLKYKTQLQSDFSFFSDFSELFSLAEIQYKKIFSAELMSCYANSVPQVHFSCAQYTCLSFAPAATSKKPALSIRCHVSLGEKKTSYSTFRHNHPAASLPKSYKQLDFSPPLNQPGTGTLEISSWVFFIILFFPFFFWYIFFLLLPSIPSSCSRPYQYITVVFRNSLPSATKDTQEPRISQQLTSCWRKRATAQDVTVDVT